MKTVALHYRSTTPQDVLRNLQTQIMMRMLLLRMEVKLQSSYSDAQMFHL